MKLINSAERRGGKIKFCHKETSFKVNENGLFTITLPHNPKCSQVYHELLHYLDYKKLGFFTFNELSSYEKELRVFYSLKRNSKHWNNFTEREKFFAENYKDKHQVMAGENQISRMLKLNLEEQQKCKHELQRRLLRINLCTNKTGLIAHHLIPLQSLKIHPELMTIAAKGGFDINGKLNGMALTKELHIGGHPLYNSDVNRLLEKIAKDMKKKNLTAAAVAKLVQSTANTLKRYIKSGRYGPWK